MLNKDQLKLVQIAVKAAGIRPPGGDDRRYRLLLAQYVASNGSRVKSSKQLNNWQLDDLLAICESMGWRHPQKTHDYYRRRIRSQHQNDEDRASFAMRQAIRHLAGDLGWTDQNLKGMICRMTKGRTGSLSQLRHRQGWAMIEAMKHMLSRKDGKSYQTLKNVKDEYQPPACGGLSWQKRNESNRINS